MLFFNFFEGPTYKSPPPLWMESRFPIYGIAMSEPRFRRPWNHGSIPQNREFTIAELAMSELRFRGMEPWDHNHRIAMTEPILFVTNSAMTSAKNSTRTITELHPWVPMSSTSSLDVDEPYQKRALYIYSDIRISVFEIINQIRILKLDIVDIWIRSDNFWITFLVFGSVSENLNSNRYIRIWIRKRRWIWISIYH